MRKYATTLVLMLFVVQGCAMLTEKLGLEKPTTFAEQVAYVEGTSQGLITTVQVLTCRKYAAGTCTEAGRPFHPLTGKEYLQKLSTARTAAKQASVIPSAGVGQCLGETKSATACLQLANALLTEVQKVLEQYQPK